MRRPRFAPMFSIMATFWLNPDQRTVRQGVICLTEIFFLRILDSLYNIHGETTPAEGTDRKEVGEILLILPVILYELWIHERDKEK